MPSQKKTSSQNGPLIFLPELTQTFNKVIKVNIRMRVIHLLEGFRVAGIQRGHDDIGFGAVPPDIGPAQQGAVGDDDDRVHQQAVYAVDEFAESAVEGRFAGTADGDNIGFEGLRLFCVSVHPRPHRWGRILCVRWPAVRLCQAGSRCSFGCRS